jgi:hypothetical protein
MNIGSMLYGAALSGALTLVLVAFAAKDRRPGVLITVGSRRS